MNVEQILNKTMTLVTPKMHATRRKSLTACVSSMLHGAYASVTSIGRGISSSAKEKHNIKRADRLLSNANLQNEVADIYRLLGKLFTSASGAPIIHVDWSDLDARRRHFLLRATLSFEGRSITLYEEVHCIKTKEKPATHRRFLNVLSTILPTNSTPIIVTDAGFKRPWFKAVLDLGWDYVGRARKPNFCHSGDEKWRCISSLYPDARLRPKAFKGQLCRNSPYDVNFVLYKQKAQGRHKLNRFGEVCRSAHSKANASRSRDPWLLVTSLPNSSDLGKRAVKIYKTRMQIEESFRDMKSHRYGLGYSTSLSQSKSRITILILLSTLAYLVALLTGWTVTLTNKHRHYQANTKTNRRVLSFHFVGLRAFIDKQLRLTKAEWKNAMRQLHNTILEVSYDSL